MAYTDTELAEIERYIPGFSQMSPIQQQAAIRQLKAQNNPSQQPSSGNSALQIGGTAVAANGLNSIINGGSKVPSTIPTPPILGQSGAAPSILGNFGSMGIGPQAGIVAGTALLAKGTSDLIKGKNDKSPIGLAARGQTAITSGGLSEVARATGLNKIINGGKSEDQQGRDKTRENLQTAGIYDPDFNLTLSDGTKVNMGVDGSIKNYNISPEDLKSPTSGKYIALIAPFGAIAAQGDVKRSSDVVGELFNAVKGTKDPLKEIKALYEKAGIYKEDALAAIDALKDLDDKTREVYKSSINELNLSARPKEGSTATAGSGVTGGGSKVVVIRQPTYITPKPQKTDTATPYRMDLLNKMLAQNSQPIQYPTQAQQPQTPGFSETMNKIIGG